MKTVFNEVFKMLNLKEVWIIVNFKVIRNRNKHTLMLNQTSYVTKVLFREKMKNYLHVEIFMKSELFITLDEMNNVMTAISADM